MKKSIVFVLLLGLALPLLAQSKPMPTEELIFDGYYNWGFIWMKAGRVEFTTGPSEKYKGARKLNAIGYTLPSWEWVFKLRDTLTSHHDPKTFLPYEFSRRAHEGKYHKTFDYYWNNRDTVIYAHTHRLGRKPRQDTLKLKPETFDMLSVAWMSRELDFDKYRKNEMIPVKILIDNKIYDLHVRYLGIDKLKIDKDQVDCYVFSPLLVEGEVFKGGENMKIWVSKDDYRLPLMVEAKILVGSVKGILNRKESKYHKSR